MGKLGKFGDMWTYPMSVIEKRLKAIEEKITQITGSLSGFVPDTRKVNGKALKNNVNLTASDVGALSASTTAVDISTAFTYDAETYGGNCDVQAFYDPASKTVRGNFYVLNATTPIDTSANFITIAEEYRPAVNTRYSLVAVTGTTFTTYKGLILTTGGIKQDASSTVTRILGVFEYLV